MKHTEFDLPGFLLGEIYIHMDDDDARNWNRNEADALAHDLRTHDGIDCEPDAIFEIVSEFIRQDTQD